MTASQELAVFLFMYIGVDLGRGNRAVAEEVLDVTDVDAFLEEECGDGMAEHVRCHMEWKTRLQGPLGEHFAYCLLGEWATGPTREEVTSTLALPLDMIVAQGGKCPCVRNLDSP